MDTYLKFRKSVSLLAVVSVTMMGFAFVLAQRVSAGAISGMSLSNTTGIVDNSSDVNVLVEPEVNFTTSNPMTFEFGVSPTDSRYFQFTLNGIMVDDVADLDAADFEFTTEACDAGFLGFENQAGNTPDDGNFGILFEEGNYYAGAGDYVDTNDYLRVTIYLDSNTGADVTCAAGAYTLTYTPDAGVVTSSTDAHNYPIFINTYGDEADNGAFLYYVGDENDVEIRATVANVFTFVIRTDDDTADQPNVDGLAVGPNLCDLGTLSVSTVEECAYRLKITTNANNGYYVQVFVDDELNNSDDSYALAGSNGTILSPGTEAYTVLLDAGSSTSGTVVTCDGVITTGDCLADTYDWTDYIAFDNTAASTMYDVNSPNSPAVPTDTVNTALVTHYAAISGSTPAGFYNQLATYTVTARW